MGSDNPPCKILMVVTVGGWNHAGKHPDRGRTSALAKLM
jgi:hypothetical protein